MLHHSAFHELNRLMWRSCTLLMFVCVLTPNLGAIPAFWSMAAPGAPLTSEEESQSVIRCDCPRHRQFRLRSLPVRWANPLPDLRALQSPLQGWRLPQPSVLPCLVGAGIRLIC